jgi:hypothetical protein
MKKLDGIGIGGAEIGHGAGAAGIAGDHDEVVELAEDVDAGLVDGRDDGFSVVGEAFEKFDYAFGVVGGKAGSGLVEKKDRRVGDQFHGDVDALALAAAEDFAFGRADARILFVADAEFFEEAVNALCDFGVGQVGAQLGRKVQGFADGKFGMNDVVLRNVAHLLAEQIVIAVEVRAVEQNVAGGGRGVAVERFEECGFSGAGRAHESDEFGGIDGE